MIKNHIPILLHIVLRGIYYFWMFFPARHLTVTGKYDNLLGQGLGCRVGEVYPSYHPSLSSFWWITLAMCGQALSWRNRIVPWLRRFCAIFPANMCKCWKYRSVWKFSAAHSTDNTFKIPPNTRQYLERVKTFFTTGSQLLSTQVLRCMMLTRTSPLFASINGKLQLLVCVVVRQQFSGCFRDRSQSCQSSLRYPLN